jgi:malonyl-CoA decarboxylase
LAARRLGRDRRVYAFFLKDAPNEPLVFVHVALVPSISNSVQAILDATDVNSESQFKCATCYSITTQQGLGGINLGNYLIKRVVQDLKLQFPQLETFCTLSPIPRFKRWLLEHLKEEDIQRQFKQEIGQDWYMVKSSFQCRMYPVLIQFQKLDRFNQQDQIELKNTLMSMCARYILMEKRNGTYATDPVGKSCLSLYLFIY